MDKRSGTQNTIFQIRIIVLKLVSSASVDANIDFKTPFTESMSRFSENRGQLSIAPEREDKRESGSCLARPLPLQVKTTRQQIAK